MAGQASHHPAVRRATIALGAVGLAYVLQSVVPIIIWRTRWPPAVDALRQYMKRVGNVRERERAGTPGSRTTAIHHVGRSSGREYVTPVWAERLGDRFYIHLPYGTHTDWCRNVLAAGGCVVHHDGVRFETTGPVLLPAADVRPLLPTAIRRMQQVVGAEFYLRLDIVPG
jgi:deazaflavin-dependent oxidoreductase (nitroreductase family)